MCKNKNIPFRVFLVPLYNCDKYFKQSSMNHWHLKASSNTTLWIFKRAWNTYVIFVCGVLLAESLILTKPLLSFASSTLRASVQTCSDSTHYSIPFGSMNYRQRACSFSLNILHLRPNTISLHWFYFGNMPWMWLISLIELQQIFRLVQPLICAVQKDLQVE